MFLKKGQHDALQRAGLKSQPFTRYIAVCLLSVSHHCSNCESFIALNGCAFTAQLLEEGHSKRQIGCNFWSDMCVYSKSIFAPEVDTFALLLIAPLSSVPRHVDFMLHAFIYKRFIFHNCKIY